MARPAGAISKRSTAARRMLKELLPNYDPLVEMARMANDPEVEPQLRLSAHKEVVKYIWPQLKAQELTVEGGEAPVRTVVELVVHEPKEKPV